jgi:hypothetical protein
MAMDYWHAMDATNATESLDGILTRGLELGAYIEGVGWSHRGLVAVAQSYGYEGFNVDAAQRSPTPKSLDEAWGMLLEELSSGPVLASVFAGLDAARGGGHIVLVTGTTDGLVLFNDPEEMGEWEGRKTLALSAFLSAFKSRYIVIRPARS